MSDEYCIESLESDIAELVKDVAKRDKEIARLRIESERLTAWARRAYEAMCRYDESLMVSCVADAPPQVQEGS